jgi:hypothetical protein
MTEQAGKTMMQRFWWILVVLVSVLLSSCLKYEEVLQLNPDGSGKWNIHLEILHVKDSTQYAEGILPGLKERIESVSGIYLQKQLIQQKEGVLEQDLEISFADIKLFATPELDELRSLLGQIQWAQFTADTNGQALPADRGLQYQRTIHLDHSAGDGGIEPYFKSLFGQLYGAQSWRYELHTPTTIIDSLSTGKAGLQENVRIWEYTLADLLKGPVVMQVQTRKDLVEANQKRLYIIGVVAIAVLLVLLMLLWRFMSWRKKRRLRKEEKAFQKEVLKQSAQKAAQDAADTEQEFADSESQN